MNDVAVSMCVQMFARELCAILWGYIPKSRIASLYGNSKAPMHLCELLIGPAETITGRG
jgi:hypothetical protein